MRIAPIVVLASWLGGCEVEPDLNGETMLRRDSAGVEVITHLTVIHDLPLDSIGNEPVLAITSEEQGEVVLDRISGIGLLGDGGIAVGSHGTKTVYVFDDKGGLRRTLGGPGDGPGEFRGIMNVFPVRPDSIAVFDNWLGRVTIFSREGEVGRTIDVRRFLPPAAGSAIYPVSAGLALVGIASVSGRRQQSTYRDSADSYLLSLEGDSVGHYGRFPGYEVMYAERLFGGLPFGASLTSGPQGDHLIIGTGDEPELREYSPGGRLVRLIRWPDRDREVSPERVERYVEFRLSLIPENERAAAGATLRELPYSPIAPAYHRLVTASDGSFWLEDYPGPELIGPSPPVRSRTWTIFGSDGVRMRRVVGPPGFALEAVSSGLAYGVHTNDLGVQSVEVYRVPPS